ncbi:MAG: HAMP domain-containing protein [Ignavibacteriales bacterium]|nr:HAMP domain-containing protein [Ignavibacteriales bacterium]
MQTPFFNSLRFKIGFGYIVLVFINVAVTAWAIFNFGRITLAFNSILNENYPHVVVLERMAHLVARHEHGLSMILNGEYNNGYSEFSTAKEEFYQIFDKANESRSIPDAGAILDDIRSTYEGYLTVSDTLFSLAIRNRDLKARSYYGNIVRPFAQRLSDNAFWLIEENQKEMMRIAKESKTTSDEAIIAVLFAALVAVSLSILTMVQFTKRIIEPAEKLTETVNQIGRGRLDLKTDISTKDEIGELSREFNKMTERLRKFEALNIEKIISEKQKSETIVESISDAIIVCDEMSTIQLMNNSAEMLLNLKEDEVHGKKIEMVITDERLLEIFKTPKSAAVLNAPYLQFKYNGRQVFLRPRVSEISGGKNGMVLILQDVTQFKELDKMKSDFMAAVSHEFRTPLTSINMSVDILRQKLLGELSDKQMELLESSKQDCDRLTKMVKDLLQLSKLESGKLEVKEEFVDIVNAIEAAMQPLQLPFKEKGVILKLNVSEKIPQFIGDEQQLIWVISNLLNNALRYTKAEGKVEVSVLKAGNNIRIDVADTGRGIPPEYIDKIFDKFVQVKQQLDSTPGSVGLGLAIAMEIVEMYGGNISVKSELGKGTIFTILLPIPEIEKA